MTNSEQDQVHSETNHRLRDHGYAKHNAQILAIVTQIKARDDGGLSCILPHTHSFLIEIVAIDEQTRNTNNCMCLDWCVRECPAGCGQMDIRHEPSDQQPVVAHPLPLDRIGKTPIKS